MTVEIRVFFMSERLNNLDNQETRSENPNYVDTADQL